MILSLVVLNFRKNLCGEGHWALRMFACLWNTNPTLGDFSEAKKKVVEPFLSCQKGSLGGEEIKFWQWASLEANFSFLLQSFQWWKKPSCLQTSNQQKNIFFRRLVERKKNNYTAQQIKLHLARAVLFTSASWRLCFAFLLRILLLKYPE